MNGLNLRLLYRGAAAIAAMCVAAGGIGEETARGLLAAGHIVYGGARRRERMNPLIEAGARTLALDVSDDTSMTTALQSIVAGPVPAAGAARSCLRRDDVDGRTSAEKGFDVMFQAVHRAPKTKSRLEDSTARSGWRTDSPERDLKTLGVSP